MSWMELINLEIFWIESDLEADIHPAEREVLEGNLNFLNTLKMKYQ